MGHLHLGHLADAFIQSDLQRDTGSDGSLTVLTSNLPTIRMRIKKVFIFTINNRVPYFMSLAIITHI